ncbi:Superkiller protein 3 [Gryganskiella cystojenkinii]|nr:Superkiller protein 3 [Gryganskiella cystojenkinii]
MATVKINLKNAREAITNKNYEDALKWTEKVLDSDSSNYMGLVFSGLAYQNLGQADKGEDAFKRAISSNPELPLAQEGLINFYEKLKKWPELSAQLERMLEVHLKAQDVKKAQSTTERLIELYKEQDNINKAIEKMKYLLPGGRVSELGGDLPEAMDMLKTLASLQEKHDKEFFEREVKARRGRLGGGTLEQVQATVRKELYGNSELGSTYESILELDHQNNKDLELKLLDFYINKIDASFAGQKLPLREKASNLAKSMTNDGCTSTTPYEFLLKFTDAASPSDYDSDLQELYISKFPETGFSKLIQAQMHYGNGEATEEVFEQLESGLKSEPGSPYGYLVACWMDHDSQDYETGLDHATLGLEKIEVITAASGFQFTQYEMNMLSDPNDRMRRSFQLCAANCQFKISPKLNPSTLSLYLGILKEDANNIEAHKGVGFVHCSEAKFKDATASFNNVLALDPDNISARSEIAWIAYLQKDFESAEEKLREVIDLSEEPRALDLYRLGRTYYDMGGEYRSNSEYSYSQLIAAAKLDPHCAGAFTYLGHYYHEVVEDDARAEKCYQHAFTLDPREGEAGRILSDYLLKAGSLEGAMDIYQQVITADAKANWALNRLGFAELIQGNNNDAITSFQKLLRNDINNALAWEGVAEAYQHEGRYMAALKAFRRTRDLQLEATIPSYHISRVHQKLGMYPEAIEYYQATLELAERNQEPAHIPSLMGMAESYLEQGKEFFVSGYYGRSAESYGRALEFALQLVSLDGQIMAAWKLIGDACVGYRSVPKYLGLCPVVTLSSILDIIPEDTNSLLHFPEKLDQDSFVHLRNLSQSSLLDATTEHSSQTLDAVYALAGLAYKRANIINGNQGHQAADFWFDIALTYYYRHESALKKNRAPAAAELASQWLGVSTRCLKASLQFEEENPMVWNALGIATLSTNAKISQHSFIKAIEYDPKNAAPWSNLGFLYLLNTELELANNAFKTAQTLDPSFAQAWTGQACVASLWESAESTALFAHACESSTSSILEANYGYAVNTFTDILGNLHKASKTATSPSSANPTTLLVTPAFALSKYLEQRPRDIAAWNLLGLIRERFMQQAGAAECFLTAIRVLNEDEGEKQEDGSQQTRRRMMLHHNLARALLSIQDYAGAVEAYEISLELEGPDAQPSVIRTCKHLGAGLALYYAGELERSLAMFEVALAETEQVEGMEKSRDDVMVLLSQVLWALGGDEQRAVAKDELFRCIAQSPTHLPAIFGLGAMGLVQNDETLATAALKEILKFSRQELAEMDPESRSDKMISQYYSLLNEPKLSIAALSKSVHEAPSEGALWRRLSEHLSQTIKITGETEYAVALSNARMGLDLLAKRQQHRETFLEAQDLGRAYAQVAGTILLEDGERQQKVAGWKTAKKEKLEEEQKQSLAKISEALAMAQRAVLCAPWDTNAWQVIGTAFQTLSELDT